MGLLTRLFREYAAKMVGLVILRSLLWPKITQNFIMILKTLEFVTAVLLSFGVIKKFAGCSSRVVFGEVGRGFVEG